MAVRLSALRADRSLPPGIFLVLISVRGWVDLMAIVGLEGLGKLKKSNYLIWNRTRDLPVCSIVPQRTTLPRALYHLVIFSVKMNHSEQRGSLTKLLSAAPRTPQDSTQTDTERSQTFLRQGKIKVKKVKLNSRLLIPRPETTPILYHSHEQHSRDGWVGMWVKGYLYQFYWKYRVLTSISLYRESFKQLDAFKVLGFTATGASPAAIFVDDSACLTADNVWNEGK
jgi:hypothetical protein